MKYREVMEVLKNIPLCQKDSLFDRSNNNTTGILQTNNELHKAIPNPKTRIHR